MRIQGQLVCIAPFASPKLLISPPLLSLRATFGNEFSGLDCHYPTQDIDMELISSAHGCLSSHHIHHYSYRVMNTINSGVINLEKFDRGSLSTGLFA